MNKHFLKIFFLFISLATNAFAIEEFSVNSDSSFNPTYKNKFSLEQIGVSFFNICFVDIQVILKFLFLEKPNYVQTFSGRKTHFTCFCQFISIEIIHFKLAYFFLS